MPNSQWRSMLIESCYDYWSLQMKADYKKQKLKVINTRLGKVVEGLMELSRFPEHCECLKVLSESGDLIEWLKSETGS